MSVRSPLDSGSPPVEGPASAGGDATLARRLAPRFGGGREYLGNHYVYLMFCARAGGLTVGVNLNPDRRCNFDCVYCEVHRHRPSRNGGFCVDVMARELASLLDHIQSGQIRELSYLHNLPRELLELRHVALSGEGEPTLCPQFAEAVQAVVHVRAMGHVPFFKIVLLSNASLLDQPQVQAGLRCFIHQDELWLKLDAGTPETFQRINRPEVGFDKVLSNILHVARQRPVVIQSLFPLIDGGEPAETEVAQFASRLKQLKSAGAQISLVQVYSASRPTARSECRHLPLKTLSRIAHFVRTETGLSVQVF